MIQVSGEDLRKFLVRYLPPADPSVIRDLIQLAVNELSDGSLISDVFVLSSHNQRLKVL